MLALGRLAFSEWGQIRVARLSWFKLLSQSGAADLQMVWSALVQSGIPGIDRASLLQFIAARESADSTAAGSAAVSITGAGGGGNGPVDILEGGGGRSLTLQIGFLQPVLDAIKLIVDSEPATPSSNEGFVGGGVEMFLYLQQHLGGLPMFEWTLGEAASWTGPASGLDQRLDTVVLDGDFSAGFTLSSVGANVTQLLVEAGNDYVLTSEDGFVGGGRLLTLDARSLSSNHVMFDGSAETDGRFAFLGSDGNDFFFGGAGNDRFSGGKGADSLSGGGGADLFIYAAAGESSGASYDTLADFNPAADKIDLPGSVASFDPAIAQGALSTASFGQDMAAVLGGLGGGQAVLFAPDSGDLAGKLFLIVDGNGTAGYQEGEDYVFAIGGASLADLTGHTEIFV
jgi:Ca2+-binding RTX toxin-like protein